MPQSADRLSFLMGSLRFLLAFSVAYSHAGGLWGVALLPGDLAVQAFYTISGFYMALVLHEVYGADDYGRFIANRLLRLLPSYAVVLLLTVVLVPVILPGLWPRLGQLFDVSPTAFAFLLVSQVTLIGQDWLNFIALKSGEIVFWQPYSTGARGLSRLAFIPQGWTLGLEMSFYLLAPFIVRRSLALIVSLILVSVAVRLGLRWGFGLFSDPWWYRFFPSELAYFLIGSLGYRLTKVIPYLALARGKLVAIAALTALPFLLSPYVYFSFGGRPLSVALLGVVSVPILFALTKDDATDTWIGGLSYPLYICHLLVFWCVAALGFTGTSRTTITLAVAVVFSVFLMVLIERPVETWRHQWRARLRNMPASAV